MGRTFNIKEMGIVFIAMFFVVSSSAFASEPLSLKPLIDEARVNNPEIKAVQERVSAKEARARAEGALDDPMLKVEIEDIEKDRPLDISSDNIMLTRYTVSQTFPFPGKLSLKKKIAFKEVEAARAMLRAKELEISSMVKEAYYDYALAAESIKITQEIKELLSYMARIAEVRYATGQVSQQDVIKVAVETTMLVNDLISLEAEKEIFAARLKAMLGRAQDSIIGEPPILPDEKVVFKTEDLIGATLRQNPEIKATEAEVDASELEKSLAKKNYYPDFMLGAAPIQRDGRFDSFDVMFQMNIPLWWGKYSNLSGEASSNARSAKAMLMSQRSEKGFEVKGAALKVEAIERMKTLFETGLVSQAEFSFDSALKNYEAGKIDFLMLLDNARELKRTRLEYVKILSEYRKSIASLERIVGEDF